MALTPGSFFESDLTGASEVITVAPASPATSTLATVASAFYGIDASGAPKPATVAVDGKSISLTVLNGFNSLVVTLVSPNPNDELVQLRQASTVLAAPTVSGHSAVSTVIIQGK